MKPLYEIAQEYKLMAEELFEAEEITPEMIERFNQASGDIKQKAINCASFIKNMEAEYECIKNAMKDMDKRGERLAKKAQRLRDYLANNLQSADIKEVKTPYFDIKVKLNNPGVSIMDENVIPSLYFKETMVKRIDKLAIKEDIQLRGMIIPGACLERKTRLEIR